MSTVKIPPNGIKALEKRIEFFITTLKGITFFVAGGFVRDFLTKRKPKDIDLFFKSYDDAQRAKVKFLAVGGELFPQGEYHSIVKFPAGPEINIIMGRNFQKPSDIDFDFICCQACMGVSAEGRVGFWSDPMFFEDAVNKVLTINNISSSLSIIERVARFSARGYSIDTVAIVLIARFINSADNKNFDLEWYDMTFNKGGL